METWLITVTVCCTWGLTYRLKALWRGKTHHIEPLIFDETLWILQASLLTTEMSHDQSIELALDMKRWNKEFEKACRDATQKFGGAQPKLGLTPIKKRNFKIWQLVLHVAAEECYCVWTDCGRVGVEQHCVEATPRWKGRRGLWTAFSVTTH